MYLQGPLWRKNSQKIIGFLNGLPVSDWRSIRIVVAFSGGIDSLFLMLALRELQKKYKYILLPVHINHGVLPEDDLYGNLAQLAAVKAGLSCQVIKSETSFSGSNLEEEMRIERYRILQEFCRKNKANYLAVAHHADDQAETVFANIVRGCGIRGLAGMAGISGAILRPLLKISKNEIREMILKTDFPYYEDKLNYSRNHRRNQIRNSILPFIEKTLAVSPLEGLLALSENMTELNSFLEGEELKIERKIDLAGGGQGEYSFSRAKFLKLSVFWRRKIIGRLITSGLKKNPSRPNILKIDFWIESGQRPALKFRGLVWSRSKEGRITLFGSQHS